MSENVVVSLLTIQVVQSKLGYLKIGNLDLFNIIQLPKFNTKETKH